MTRPRRHAVGQLAARTDEPASAVGYSLLVLFIASVRMSAVVALGQELPDGFAAVDAGR